MNAPIRRLSSIVALLFCALLVSTTWIQFVQAKELHDRPDNRRTLLASYSRERGAILVGGDPVAQSVPTGDELKYVRTLPRRASSTPRSPATTPSLRRRRRRRGRRERPALRPVRQALLPPRRRHGHRQVPGGASLELTINPAAQKAADEALGNQRGAVVALDPRTGAILAMVSHPRTTRRPWPATTWTRSSTPGRSSTPTRAGPLVNRAIAGDLYPPGSTFKLVTAAAALSSGKYTEDSVDPGPARLDLPLTKTDLPNDDGQPCGPGNQLTLDPRARDLLQHRFGGLGLKLGADALRAQAAKFGFGDSLRVPMRVSAQLGPRRPQPPRSWPSRPSASTTCASPPCRWPWSARPSPTAAWS